MNAQLEALAASMAKLDFDKARELADSYVTSHADEFTEHAAVVKKAGDEKAAQAALVKMVETLREAGLDESALRADAFILHRWHPNDVSGVFQPMVRNELAETHQPQVREH